MGDNVSMDRAMGNKWGGTTNVDSYKVGPFDKVITSDLDTLTSMFKRAGKDVELLKFSSGVTWFSGEAVNVYFDEDGKLEP